MGNPFREGMRRQRRDKRARVGTDYTPIVLWVKTPEGMGVGPVQARLREIAGDMPFVSVPDAYDEPSTEVVTPHHDTPYHPDCDEEEPEGE